METISLISMHSESDCSIIGQYASMQEASDDTLTPVLDIKRSLLDGCAINGVMWARVYIQKPSTSKKSVIQMTYNGSFIAKFDSVAQAVEKTGINNIDKAARGVIRTAGGYVWKYETL